MAVIHHDEQAIFEVARKIEAHEARETYLQQACGADAALHQRVRALLEAFEESASFLEVPASRLARTQDEPQRPGTVIGPYKLMEQIGEGGMGLVFVAEQQEPIRRKVALKIIKPGMDTRQVIARFEAERQALALMDHPNIAKVLDGGTTATGDRLSEIGQKDERRQSEADCRRPIAEGRPYFVMELVKGVPITEFCDQNQVPVRERLELFLDVCQAVQHAHQKGIIHRDIKPSNVLVMSQDGTPLVKVIDFGVAKAIGQQLTDKTIYTQFTQLVGTPLYMSPEQAGKSGLDVDTRTDIYALGVLLYELLTGTTPFDKDRLKDASYDEIRRIIREEEPPKPSTRISTLGQAATTASANRKSDPKQLSRLFRGELDWIVMKALEKDRNRRYETASGFSADVQRYLHDEPVQACPPSLAYRVRKFVRRNKGPVMAASLLLIVLLGGIAGTTLGLLRTEEALQVAETNEGKARDAVVAESNAKTQALKDKTKAERALEIVSSILEKLDPNAEEKQGKPLQAILGERLDKAIELLEGDVLGDPLTVAKLQYRLAETQLGLGYPAKAIVLFSKVRKTREGVLGAEDPATLECLRNLAEAYYADWQHDEAFRLFDHVLEKRRAKLGEDHPRTLESLDDLSVAYLDIGNLTKALPLLERAFQKRKSTLGDNHPETLHSMHNLAATYHKAWKFDLALALMEGALQKRKVRLGEDHPDTLHSMTYLAGIQCIRRNFDQGLPLMEQALRMQTAKLGDDHPGTLATMENLGGIYFDAGKREQSQEILEQCLRKCTARLGDVHPVTLRCTSNLAAAYRAADKGDQALALHQQFWEKCKAKLGENHPITLGSLHGLARACEVAGNHDRARALFEDVVKKRTAKLGDEHPDSLSSMHRLADIYQTDRKLDLALVLYEHILQKHQLLVGEEHPKSLASIHDLGVTYRLAGKLELAIATLEQAVEKRKLRLGPNDPATLNSMNSLAVAYQVAKKLSPAIPLFEEVLDKRTAKLGADHADTLVVRDNLAKAYQEAGKRHKVIALYGQSLEKLRAKLGEDHPRTLKTVDKLAKAHMTAGNTDQAIALYEQSFERSKVKPGPDAPDTLIRMNDLAWALWSARRLDRSIPLFEQNLQIRKAKLGPDHPATLVTQANLGVNYRDAGRYDEAVALLSDAWNRVDKTKLDKTKLGWIAQALADAYERTKRFDQQEKVLQERLALVREQTPAHPDVVDILAQLGLCLMRQEKYAAAEPVLKDCLAMHEKKEPDAWTTFQLRSLLGGSLLGQKKYAEAEPLLIKGYEGLKQRQARIPTAARKVRVTEALQRVIQLYEAWGRQDDAAKWRKQLEGKP